MKKILFVLNSADRTGASIYAEKIISHISAFRNEYSIFVHFAREGDFLEEFFTLPTPVLRTCSKSKKNSGFFNLLHRVAYYIDFINILHEVKPDLVYSNTTTNNGQVILSKLFFAKTVVHCHEGIVLTQRLRYRIWLSNLFTDKYIAVSHYAASALKLIVKDSVSVVHNGIDFKSAYLAPSASLLNSIGIIGTIDRNKGQLLALKALDIIVNKYNINISIVMIGMVVDFGYYDELNSFIKSNNLAANVKFLGPLVGMKNIYSSINCVVSTSLDEAFPLVSLESMASGILLIASSTGGNKELIDNGKSGFLYPVEDYECLAETIIKVYHDRELHLRVVEYAKNQIINHFKLEDKLDLISKIIDKELIA